MRTETFYAKSEQLHGTLYGTTDVTMASIMKGSMGWRGVHYPSPARYNETGNTKVCRTISPNILMMLMTLPKTPDNLHAHARVCDRKEVMETPEDLRLGHQLNSTQRQCIAGAVTSEVTLMHGPPGTGKSSTSVATVEFVHQMLKSLVAANKDVDAIFDRVPKD